MDKSPLFTGKRQKARCGRCQCFRYGMAFQNRTRWMIRFDCGHVKVLGYTRPTDELEESGLLNGVQQGDPYADQVEAHKRELKEREAREWEDHTRHKQNRTVNDRYFLL